MNKVLLLEGRKFSSLKGSINHILNNDREEVVFEGIYIPPGIGEEKEAPLVGIKEIFKKTEDRKKKIEIAERFIRLVETDLGKKRIRKNASWKEIVLSYPQDEDIEEVRKDLSRFLKVFEEEFGFRPAGVFAIHRHEGRVHFHYIFSTRNLKTGKKVDLKPSKWIQVVGNVVGKGVIREIEKTRKSGGGRVALKWIRVLAVKLVQLIGLSSEEAYKQARLFVRGAKKLSIPKKEIMQFIKHFEENPEENYQILLEVISEFEKATELKRSIKTSNRRRRKR